MKTIIKKIFTKTTPSRAALVGNPSDGFYGGTIAIPVRNWGATVTLKHDPEKEGIHFILNDLHDMHSFNSLDEFVETTKKEGFYGGIRLLKATLKQFYEYCQLKNIELHANPFSLGYTTNIPKLVGLAGSSAIITSCLESLIEFYGVERSQLPLPIQANLVLNTELEQLKIKAGLQDRVVQVYNEPVYMDFSKKAFKKNKGLHGEYQVIPKELFPNFFIVYSTESEESERVHTNLHFRYYEEKEPELIEAMKKFAEYTRKAKTALENKDHKEFFELMDMNFDLRKQIIGEDKIGKKNLEMVEIARASNACANFSGSGGAIIGIYRNEEHFNELEKEFHVNGYKLIRVVV